MLIQGLGLPCEDLGLQVLGLGDPSHPDWQLRHIPAEGLRVAQHPMVGLIFLSNADAIQRGAMTLL